MTKINDPGDGGDASDLPNNELVFDVIVIGSGYGGAVSACRFAEAGYRVAILETGYRHQAPNILRGEASEWNPKAGRFGPHTITKISAAVRAWTGTAFGGGSIVNAAVMIRKSFFENWPGDITRESLDPFYDLAESMLGAKVYPVNVPGSLYDDTIKTRTMLEAAVKLGVPSVQPAVAITYREAGEAEDLVKVNQHGAPQMGCRRCGECSLPGCNYLAKNSLDFNYLWLAEKKYGATVFTGNKVDKIEPLTNRTYSVRSIDSKSGKERMFRAKVVVVAAGATGSSELLLRNKHWHNSLSWLSDKLGSQYTTNGTFIGFAVRSKTDLDPSGGPEITAGLDFSGADGQGQGHLMFDGSFRGFTYETFFITGRLVGMGKGMIKLLSGFFKLAEKVKFLEPRTTLPLLVIGRDNASGKLSLTREGKLTTDLRVFDNASFYARANEYMRAFTKAMGTKFLPFPLWWLQRKIDVPHNLGGVPMGRSKESGVVDHLGRVFGYDNFLVLDGSIVPATMGANPALTIAALAERSMATVIPELKKRSVIRAVPEPEPVAPPVVDATAEFHNLYEALEEGEAVALPEALEGKTVLWTPGILARHVGNHSKHVLAAIAEMGLKVTAIPVDTDVATLENIELIKAHVRKLSAGEGILVGHSRGGIMNLDAYRQLNDEDKAKITRIILVQSPINGTPLADFVVKRPWLRRTVAWGSRVVLGNNIMDTLRELSTRGREVAQRALPALTADDLAKILVVRSVIAPGQSPSLDLTRKLNEQYGQVSDGVTPFVQSAIPGTRDVFLGGFDHENLVVYEPGWFKRLTGYRAHAFYVAGYVIEALLRLSVR
jgi:choline dehydrogenase-like flavoprotein